MIPVTTVGFIGAGNMAWNIAHNLSETSYSIEQVIARTSNSVQEFQEKFDVPAGSTSLADIHPDLDMVFILTSDHAIGEVADQLEPLLGKHTIVVHASGSMPLSVLDKFGERAGIFYPLQTMNKMKPVSFRDIPLFTEKRKISGRLIEKLAMAVSDKVKELDSESRLKLHLGAVFACNYSNLMWLIANEVLLDLPGIGMEVYQPLLKQTLENALKFSPHESMTGPARRRDDVTLDKHIAILEAQNPDLAELYKLLAKQIQQRF